MTQEPEPIEIIPAGDAHLTSVGLAREALISLVMHAVDSPNTQRNYRIALDEFLDWWDAAGRPVLTKAVVQEYKTVLQGRGLAPSTINLKLSAIRKLVAEAADNGLIDPVHANGIKAVKGAKTEGHRSGNWLTRQQAQALLNAPDPATVKGLRDRALLAVLLLAGLRRDELAHLTFDHLQLRDNRWVIVDILGKRGKVRSVPINNVVKTVIDDWAAAAGIREGYVLRSMRRGDHLSGESLSNQAVWYIVRQYAAQLGLEGIAPHDLRRTYAKLAHKGGAAIEQISLNLGHGSVKTTEIYLGVDLDLQNAPSDYIDLSVDERPQQLPDRG